MSINKIKKSKDFSLIYNKSQKMHTKYAIIFIKENVNNEQRFGFVASKKTGNAVQRNRIKRIFKEFVKIHKDKFKNEEDLYFENIKNRLNSEDSYKFKLNDYPDNAVIYIGNYDSDKNIEVFFYEFMGISIELPIEITPLGKVQKQGVFNNVFLIFSIIMNMFFSYIFVFICCILVLAVLMTHMGIKFLWVIKK